MSGRDGVESQFGKFLVGLVVGVVATFVYIRFGVELPGAAGVGQRITTEAIVKTAEFEFHNTANDPIVRRRALAVILANRPDEFLQIDAEIGNQFFDAYLRQSKVKNRVGTNVFDSQSERFGYGTPTLAKFGNQTVNLVGVADANRIPDLKKQTSLRGVLIASMYPDASSEVIDFLVRHPELDRQLNHPPTGLISSSGKSQPSLLIRRNEPAAQSSPFEDPEEQPAIRVGASLRLKFDPNSHGR